MSVHFHVNFSKLRVLKAAKLIYTLSTWSCNCSSVPTKYVFGKKMTSTKVCAPPHESLNKNPKFAKLLTYLLENIMCTAIFKTKKTAWLCVKAFFLAFPLSWSVNKNKTARLKIFYYCIKRNTIQIAQNFSFKEK